MKRILVSAAIAMAGLTVAPSMAQAGTITCTGADRQITVFNVLAGCHFGNSDNPDASTVATALGGTWTNEGAVAMANGTNDLLTVTVDAWGPEANGTFVIDPSFWTLYGRGAISFHVGQGGGDPDWWVFELVPGFTGNILPGTFDYDLFDGTGGGLSNVKLWGTDRPDINQLCDDLNPCAATPEPASLLLMGTGLVGFAAMLRRRTRRA